MFAMFCLESEVRKQMESFDQNRQGTRGHIICYCYNLDPNLQCNESVFLDLFVHQFSRGHVYVCYAESILSRMVQIYAVIENDGNNGAVVEG